MRESKQAPALPAGSQLGAALRRLKAKDALRRAELEREAMGQAPAAAAAEPDLELGPKKLKYQPPGIFGSPDEDANVLSRAVKAPFRAAAALGRGVEQVAGATGRAIDPYAPVAPVQPGPAMRGRGERPPEAVVPAITRQDEEDTAVGGKSIALPGGGEIQGDPDRDLPGRAMGARVARTEANLARELGQVIPGIPGFLGGALDTAARSFIGDVPKSRGEEVGDFVSETVAPLKRFGERMGQGAAEAKMEGRTPAEGLWDQVGEEAASGELLHPYIAAKMAVGAARAPAAIRKFANRTPDTPLPTGDYFLDTRHESPIMPDRSIQSRADLVYQRTTHPQFKGKFLEQFSRRQVEDDIRKNQGKRHTMERSFGREWEAKQEALMDIFNKSQAARRIPYKIMKRIPFDTLESAVAVKYDAQLREFMIAAKEMLEEARAKRPALRLLDDTYMFTQRPLAAKYYQVFPEAAGARRALVSRFGRRGFGGRVRRNLRGQRIYTNSLPDYNPMAQFMSYIDQFYDTGIKEKSLMDAAGAETTYRGIRDDSLSADVVKEWSDTAIRQLPHPEDTAWFRAAYGRIPRKGKVKVGETFVTRGLLDDYLQPRGKVKVQFKDPITGLYRITVDGVRDPVLRSYGELMAMKHELALTNPRPLTALFSDAAQAGAVWVLGLNPWTGMKGTIGNAVRTAEAESSWRVPKVIASFVWTMTDKVPRRLLLEELRDVGIHMDSSFQLFDGFAHQGSTLGGWARRFAPLWVPRGAVRPVAQALDRASEIAQAILFATTHIPDGPHRPLMYLLPKARLKAQNPTWSETKLRREAAMEAAKYSDLNGRAYTILAAQNPYIRLLAYTFQTPGLREMSLKIELLSKHGTWGKARFASGVAAAVIFWGAYIALKDDDEAGQGALLGWMFDFLPMTGILDGPPAPRILARAAGQIGKEVMGHIEGEPPEKGLLDTMLDARGLGEDDD